MSSNLTVLLIWGFFDCFLPLNQCVFVVILSIKHSEKNFLPPSRNFNIVDQSEWDKKFSLDSYEI